jgi:hypothetical protein
VFALYRRTTPRQPSTVGRNSAPRACREDHSNKGMTCRPERRRFAPIRSRDPICALTSSRNTRSCRAKPSARRRRARNRAVESQGRGRVVALPRVGGLTTVTLGPRNPVRIRFSSTHDGNRRGGKRAPPPHRCRSAIRDVRRTPRPCVEDQPVAAVAKSVGTSSYASAPRHGSLATAVEQRHELGRLKDARGRNVPRGRLASDLPG